MHLVISLEDVYEYNNRVSTDIQSHTFWQVIQRVIKSHTFQAVTIKSHTFSNFMLDKILKLMKICLHIKNEFLCLFESFSTRTPFGERRIQ